MKIGLLNQLLFNGGYVEISLDHCYFNFEEGTKELLYSFAILCLVSFYQVQKETEKSTFAWLAIEMKEYSTKYCKKGKRNPSFSLFN